MMSAVEIQAELVAIRARVNGMTCPDENFEFCRKLISGSLHAAIVHLGEFVEKWEEWHRADTGSQPTRS